MKNKIGLLAIVLVVLLSCKTQFQVAQVQPQKNTSITSEIKENQDFVNVITPYKQGLEKEMNTKISHTNVDLNKKGDNSNLGNLLADFTYEGAQVWAKNNNIPIEFFCEKFLLTTSNLKPEKSKSIVLATERINRDWGYKVVG